ncbi:unnamed protein product [Cochlearia groenlandica]
MDSLFIPTDLIVKILESVPIRSLLRFKAVRKSWKKMIEEPRFVKATMKNGQKDKIFLYTKGSQLWILDPRPPFKNVLYCDFEGEVIRSLSQCDGLTAFSSIHVLGQDSCVGWKL